MIEPLERAGTWRTYSIADGLPGMRIHHIAADGEGNLWFATRTHGAARYDGEEFQSFTTRDGPGRRRRANPYFNSNMRLTALNSPACIRYR